MLFNALQILGQIEPGLLQMIQQPIYRGHTAVNGGRFAIAAYSEEEEGYETETVVEDGVDSVQLIAFALSEAIEEFDLLDELFVELDNVGGFDVGAAVGFEQREVVADYEDAV